MGFFDDPREYRRRNDNQFNPQAINPERCEPRIFDRRDSELPPNMTTQQVRRWMGAVGCEFPRISAAAKRLSFHYGVV